MKPIPIHAFNPGPITGDGNWTWLLPGRVPTLVDAGTGEPRHIDALQQALGGSRLAQVLVTHGHGDHASGSPAIARDTPGTRFRKMPWPQRDDKWPVAWESLIDGDVIDAGDTSLVAVHTPGHAPDHLCFWHAGTRTLFCGDLAVKGTTVWIPTTLGGDLSEYLASLERVLALQPARLYPAHGPVIDNPEWVLRGYIAHRLEREEQVLDALRLGDASAEEMLARIYKDLRAPLRPMARESLLSHLIKLEREGRVRRDGEEWRLMSSTTEHP